MCMNVFYHHKVTTTIDLNWFFNVKLEKQKQEIWQNCSTSLAQYTQMLMPTEKTVNEMESLTGMSHYK